MTILPFQQVTTRNRKVESDAPSVRSDALAFDLILLNDRPLLQERITERRRLLFELFKEVHACMKDSHYLFEHVDLTANESTVHCSQHHRRTNKESLAACLYRNRIAAT